MKESDKLDFMDRQLPTANVPVLIDNWAKSATSFDITLTLPFELRQRSRLRVKLDDNTDAGLLLPRGHILRHGDRLLASDGRIVEIRAACEEVSTVHARNGLDLLRAAYHLGNRHVPLQIASDWLRYVHDRVLDEMVIGLGLSVDIELAPFEPEAGAYKAGHTHEH
ncbi:urease accessory protein UreE [Acidihalobacter prosperus]